MMRVATIAWRWTSSTPDMPRRNLTRGDLRDLSSSPMGRQYLLTADCRARIRAEIEVGMVGVNVPIPVPIGFSTGVFEQGVRELRSDPLR
jgi:hypothetical protein